MLGLRGSLFIVMLREIFRDGSGRGEVHKRQQAQRSLMGRDRE